MSHAGLSIAAFRNRRGVARPPTVAARRCSRARSCTHGGADAARHRPVHRRPACHRRNARPAVFIEMEPRPLLSGRGGSRPDPRQRRRPRSGARPRRSRPDGDQRAARSRRMTRRTPPPRRTRASAAALWSIRRPPPPVPGRSGPRAGGRRRPLDAAGRRRLPHDGRPAVRFRAAALRRAFQRGRRPCRSAGSPHPDAVRTASRRPVRPRRRPGDGTKRLARPPQPALPPNALMAPDCPGGNLGGGCAGAHLGPASR